ncbi:MAG: tRNA guanosine(34) transglycosylase Tgt [SAR202 cluster bacterium Io17-Chloro-G2]|nr:MAG: tRNA guanosine(34) transglycosylase Tgt [SAR202 cluster bacterium Io17-Chloro-G2]
MSNVSTQFSFELQHSQGLARAGAFTTSHGTVTTPVFMPVATQASVKALTPDEVVALGAQIVLSNAYHLYLQPGVELVRGFGGLHRFMGWSKPILTDSGGFQAFSMGALRKIDDSGIRFRSHLDGSEHMFSPQLATRNQQTLGADITMCLDQCIAHGESRQEVESAMERTHAWAQQCHRLFNGSGSTGEQALFGIVQGGSFPELREESAKFITNIPFQGYAIGGLAVGESKEQMYEITEQVAGLLPPDKPRYLMGVGSPEDLVEGVARGVDMFDCVLPTRVARNGALFTPEGRVDITKRRFAQVDRPLVEDCDCYTCRNFTAAYLWHLFRAKELLALRLASIHNLRFIVRLMEEMRKAIIGGTFDGFRKEFNDTYRPTNAEARQEHKDRWLESRGR